MFNKAVYAVNIFLVLILTYNLHSMWRQMSGKNSGTVSEHTVQWISVSKASENWAADEKNLFDTKPVVVKKTKDAAAKSGDDPLNEKGLGAVTLRVRGIFISPEQRFAVMDKVSKKTSKSETVKLITGGIVAGFTVQRIQSDVVTLVDAATGERVVMKIFKPVQDIPESRPKN
jgi:hypothetical protein